MTLFLISVVLVVLFFYAAFGREILKKQVWAQAFFHQPIVEWIEIHFWQKSETILLARLKMASGALLTFLTMVGGLDITPLMPLVPDAWEPTVKVLWNMLPMSLTVLGWIDEQLRKNVTKPLEQVALPEVKSPELAAAVENAKAAQEEVKVAIAIEKAATTGVA